MCVLATQSCLTLCDSMDWSPPACSVHGTFQARNTGVGYHFLLQGIFPTQGSNLGLLHCRQTLNHLSHQGSPETLFSQHFKVPVWGSCDQGHLRHLQHLPLPEPSTACQTCSLISTLPGTPTGATAESTFQMRSWSLAH